MNRCFGCSSFASPVFATLSRAAAKSAGARLRGAGVLRVDPNWASRVAVCKGCSLRTVANGVPHCGKPLLRQVRRAADGGCGCPIEAKAKTPGEHCPLNNTGQPRSQTPAACDCQWCVGQPAERSGRAE